MDCCIFPTICSKLISTSLFSFELQTTVEMQMQTLKVKSNHKRIKGLAISVLNGLQNKIHPQLSCSFPRLRRRCFKKDEKEYMLLTNYSFC